MFRAISIALGLGLVVLWVIGLSQNATPWLTWLNGVAALLSFGMAGLPETTSLAGRVVSPVVIAAGLGGMWAVGLMTGATRWLAWWNFVFAFGYLGFSMTSALQRPLEWFRKPRAVS